jgi:hypothetical protein
MIPIRNENTGWITGLCVEIHDLVISKYVAYRERDLEFNALVVISGMVNQDVPLKRMAELNVDQQIKDRVRRKILADFANVLKKDR